MGHNDYVQKWYKYSTVNLTILRGEGRGGNGQKVSSSLLHGRRAIANCLTA